MINFQELKRGDIIIIKFEGKPHHAAIYAPDPSQIGDLIHINYGLKRSGVIRSTLENTVKYYHHLAGIGKHLHFIHGLPDLEVIVMRPKTLDGDAIADQAEFWLRQGVNYDERRVMQSLKSHDTNMPITTTDTTLNVFEYLKFAARRNTAPIKAPAFPLPVSNFLAAIGTVLVTPCFKLPKFLVDFGLWCIEKSTKGDRARGFSCGGFVLACIGAVALKDEIKALTPDVDWVSLKHGNLPADQSKYVTARQSIDNKLQTDDQSKPGLHTLLTQEQIQNFDVDRLAKKLTPFVANINPNITTINAFENGFKADKDNWQDLGLLDMTKIETQTAARSKPFNKAEYKDESKKILADIRANQQIFKQNFAESAFKGKHYHNHSLFKQIVTHFTHEEIVDITLPGRLKK